MSQNYAEVAFCNELTTLILLKVQNHYLLVIMMMSFHHDYNDAYNAFTLFLNPHQSKTVPPHHYYVPPVFADTPYRPVY